MVCDEPVVARGSGPAVDQILDVLIDNARVHGQGNVTLSIRSMAGGLAVEVQDEGNSLLLADQGRICRRGVGRQHGLGLSIALALAEEQGGRVILKSGEPTTFSLVLLEPHDELSAAPTIHKP